MGQLLLHVICMLKTLPFNLSYTDSNYILILVNPNQNSNIYVLLLSIVIAFPFLSKYYLYGNLVIQQIYRKFCRFQFSHHFSLYWNEWLYINHNNADRFQLLFYYGNQHTYVYINIYIGRDLLYLQTCFLCYYFYINIMSV